MVPRMSRRTGPTAAARAVAGPVGLDAEVLEGLPGILRAGLEADPPRFAGASLLVASQAGIAYEHADGYALRDRKSTRLNSSHGSISYAVFCLNKKTGKNNTEDV